MNTYLAILFFAVAASASHIHHHVPSGSVSVGHNGVVVAGPSGSVHTDNGLHGHGAGARLSGPAGEVGTHGGHAHLSGPGVGHGHGYGGLDGGLGGLGHGHVGHVVVAPVHHVAVVHGHHGLSHGLVGHGVIGHGLVGVGHHGHHGW